MPRGNMSGGRIAISGFDYQAIVILDQLFDHFDQHPGDAREGHVVGRESSTSTGAASVPEQLRPAIAAAEPVRPTYALA